MSDRELLTECLDVLTHDAAQRTFAGGVRMSQLAIKLRTHLAAPRPEPEQKFDHSIGADRFKVVRGIFWWHIKIGDSPTEHGKFRSSAAAQKMADDLLREFRNGAFAQNALAAPSEDIETLRRENERLQNLLYDQMGEMFALRAAEQMRKQIAELKHAENERLREALAWAYNLRHLRGHSDPVVIPERFAPFIEAALQEVPR